MTKKIAEVLTHPSDKHLKKVRLEDGTIVIGALTHFGLGILTSRYDMGVFVGWDVKQLVDGIVYLCIKTCR